jgi:TolB-like protein
LANPLTHRFFTPPAANAMSKRLQVGHFEVLPEQRQVRSTLQNGAPANLGARAFDLLLCLVKHRDRVVGKDELLAQVWPGLVVEEGNLNVQIHALRKLFGSQSVVTVPGRGFQLGLEVLVAEDSAHTTPGTPAPPVASTENPAIELPLPDKPSIAVLTFTNLSDHPEQDFFCEGVTEDIITELARFHNLFVIARSSSSTYKDESTKIPQIGKELGVRYVVQGSVRRAGQRIRVTAQLVDATNGLHVWADHYDRVLEDVFAVQEEVVQAIVATVAPQVDGAEILRTRCPPEPARLLGHGYLWLFQGANRRRAGRHRHAAAQPAHQPA